MNEFDFSNYSFTPNILHLQKYLGDKIMDVRLVAPKYTSIHACAVFILITPKQLFLYQGKYSSLLEKSKVNLSLIAKSRNCLLKKFLIDTFVFLPEIHSYSQAKL